MHAEGLVSSMQVACSHVQHVYGMQACSISVCDMHARRMLACGLCVACRHVHDKIFPPINWRSIMSGPVERGECVTGKIE